MEVTCDLAKKEFEATATAFNDSSNRGIPFRMNYDKDKNPFINVLVRFNSGEPTSLAINNFEFSNKVSLNYIVNEDPMVLASAVMANPLLIMGPGAAMLNDDTTKNTILPLIKAKYWLDLTELRIQFPLEGGDDVIARINPHEPNLNKVLETCAKP